MADYNELIHSTILDAFAAGQYTAAQYDTIVGADGSDPSAAAVKTLADLFQYGPYSASVDEADTSDTVTIALVLNRPNNPMDLLTKSNWAERQAVLADQKAVFDQYGAAQSTFDAVKAALASVVGQQALDEAKSSGYVSSHENRTIWATVDASEFQALFGVSLLTIESVYFNTNEDKFSDETQYAWLGNLGLNSAISSADVGGIWVEAETAPSNPQVLDSKGVALEEGPLGIGNSADSKTEIATPAAIAKNYRFPLPDTVETPAIAIVEGGLPAYDALFDAYNDYRQAVGLATVSEEKFRIVTGAGSASAGGELTLDISTVAGGAPNSTQLLYNFGVTPFSAYQTAFFDHTNDPHILSSSWSAAVQSTADSPFYWAWEQLFIDGALRNVSVHNAAGDQGSTGYIYNGVSNVTNWQTSPFAIQVGGTSIAGRYSAGFDSTLDDWLAAALAGDPETLFGLAAAGLKQLPKNMSDAQPTPADAATTLDTLFETVWQSSYINAYPPTGGIEVGFGENEVGSGGIAAEVRIPGYQKDFGVSALTGDKRGIPDVSALSAGDTLYAVLNSDYVSNPGESVLTESGGTSAATPLWAALTAQIDAIFKDQNLPYLGYYNDLLYNAAAIAPASFNDITVGKNNNTFYSATQVPDYNGFTGLTMVTTDNGYSAQAGYDLTTGLGTPNGTILARTLTAIAHAQKSYADLPPVLDFSESGVQSAVTQSLLIQTISNDGADVSVQFGSKTLSYASTATAEIAWSSQLAGQSLQHDFHDSLVRVFDMQAQGTAMQLTLAQGDSLAITIDAAQGQTVQGMLTTDFGFVDFMVPSGSGTVPSEMVRIARPIAVAETVDGENDQAAIVRLRQDGADSLSVVFYRVDDLVGSINGLLPGTTGYAAAAEARAYQTDKGTTSIAGPGFGKFDQTRLQHVDAGDMIAMKLTNLTTNSTYWGFAQANEVSGGEPVVHLWNYGLNTWGWEDRANDGDRDFNDLIVGLDFTSASGNGWLI